MNFKIIPVILSLSVFLLTTSCSEDTGEDVSETLDETLDPVVQGQPGPSNTGPSDLSLLQPSESIDIKEGWTGVGSGTADDPYIVENVDITGSLKIRVSHVIVRNFRVTVDALYPVQLNYDGMTNVILEDGEIIGGSASSAAIIIKDGVTLRRLNLHETGGDGVKIQGSDFTMESCWVHEIGTADGSHADGVQGTVNGDGVRWSNHVYKDNFFDMAVNELTGDYESNATIFLHPTSDGNGIDNILIEDNWLIGGNFSLPIEEGMTDLVIKNNKFGQVGAEVRFGNILVESPAEITGNTYYDTGESVTD